MEVLLKKNIEKLGTKDEIVSVKNGYGRNFLIPKGVAVLATSSVKKMHAETLKQRAHKNNKLKEEATAALAKLIKKTFTVPAKVGENGKMFGSVGIPQLVEHLAAEGIVLERSMFKLHQPISKLGEHEIKVVLHPEVNTNLKLKIVEE